MLVQGAEADEIDEPSAETLSQSTKTDKTVLLSDKPGQPSPKAPRRGRALSQYAQPRTIRPLQFVSTPASQPEVYTHMVSVRLCAVSDLLCRGLPLARTSRVQCERSPPASFKIPKKK